MSAPIVLTKLHIPRTKPKLVSRPHLLALLNSITDYKLTLISASAGYGKSTLLGQWVEQTELAVAWVSLDDSDNEPEQFLSYIITALQTVKDDIGEVALELLKLPQPPGVTSIMTGLINDLRTILNEFALVLDDYHLIDNQTIHEAISLLVNHLPEPMHLIIATRADPPLPLARLRARVELLELRPFDLRFKLPESTTFFNELMNLNLSTTEISELLELTEGWVTGLQLVALAVQGHEDKARFIESFTGHHRYILNYLADEVFARQPEPVQHFLLQTVILDRLSGDLCDAVTTQRGGERTLETLEQANLFVIPLDDEQRWYRYHHLFAEFLRRRMRQWLDRDQVAQLHHRAAAWYKQRGMVEEALKHLLVVEDFEQMAALLEAHTAHLWTSGQVSLARRWLKALPDEVLYTRIELALANVLALIDVSQFDEADICLRRIEEMVNIDLSQPGIKPDNLSPEVYNEIIGLRAIILYALRRVDRAVGLVDYLQDNLPQNNLPLRSLFALNLGIILAWRGEVNQARRFLLEARQAAQAVGNTYLTFHAIARLATLQMEWGQLHQAYQAYQQALSMLKPAMPMVGWIHNSLALLFYEWDELEAAAYHASTSIELDKAKENLNRLTTSYLILAWVKQNQGDGEAALDFMQQARQIAQQHPLADLIDKVAADQAELALAQGQLEAAIQWAEAKRLGWAEASKPYEVGRALASVLLAQDKPDEALKVLEPLRSQAEAAQQVGQTIQVMLRQVLALQAQGDLSPAMMILREALWLARPGGYVRTFVDQGPALAQLLVKLTGLDDETSTYRQKLLAAFPQDAYVQPEIQHPPLYLTEREGQVLKLVATGMTNQQIADELVIARGTVKKHLDNIYAKLGVGSRTQALARATELDLL